MERDEHSMTIGQVQKAIKTVIKTDCITTKYKNVFQIFSVLSHSLFSTSSNLQLHTNKIQTLNCKNSHFYDKLTI